MVESSFMPARVALFITCVVDQFFPRAGMAMAETLEYLGCHVEFPEAQTCCGQPAFNAGWRDEARAVASRFLDVFRGYDYVVTPSGSCAAMVSRHYAELFADDPARLLQANTLAARTYEFSRFLTRVLQADDVGASFPHTVTYHDSCHALRELGIREEPRELLHAVEQLTLVEMDPPAECCGFGGTFSVKFPAVSSAMAQTKIDAIHRTGAEYVVSIDSSCLMQIGGALARLGSPVKTLHLAEVLACRA
jgi:L-lactate dehydrogenase complex protein LldE